jgi:peptide/nickel transport system permease protein
MDELTRAGHSASQEAVIVESPAALEELLTEHPDYDVQLESLNQWQLAWRRFRKHRMAIIGSVLFMTMLILGTVGPLILPYDPTTVPDPGAGNYVNAGRPPMLIPSFHPFGETVGLQRDVFTLVINGIRLSLVIGVLATTIATLIGTLVGGVAGYFGGFLDTVLMRVVDAMLSLPLLFLILVFSRFLGSGSWVTVMMIFALFGWMGIARLVRSVILSMREADWVDAARAVGVSDVRIIYRHLMPNALSPIIVSASLGVAGVIISEAFVSFLGYGIDASTPTLGNILSGAQDALAQGNWWWAFFPGAAIVVIVMGINFMGDGLQDALDPRAKI